MNFQLPSTTTATNTGFSFGSVAVAQPAAGKPGTGFSFGATGGGDASSKPLSFGFGTPSSTTAPTTATTQAATAPSLGLGGGGGATPSFGFGATAATPAATTTTQTPTLGTTTAPAPSAFGGFGAAAAAASTNATATTVQPAATVAAAPLTTGFSFGTPSASTTSSGSTTNTQTTSTGATTLTPATSTAATSKPPAAAGFASLTTATKTTDSSAVVNASQLSYNQLEEHINKWTLELEEQEKVFTDQATQINAWDKVLISNNQKILDLNDAVQKVKSDQQTLEQELEFIATQHKELEESIVPLQKEFLKIPQVDVERSQTYLMVENLDTQLKQMSEDLKEIIDNLNESNKCQDNSDPIIQIGKILNAHMSSLQWIEQSTANIGTKLEDITKMHETFKRDSERSFRSAYYN
ncbi:nuclear pore glycoprotein p62 [Stomoxys calcitrans]|uniref:nuclear pore glycoprotein p62 n=1 Tax=Stomoxys calcitrans TaxID=35570 RepID=UPI0027E36F4D|nr:nuclear pore glycoprotein p62 [Stomoxys calcitrans]